MHYGSVSPRTSFKLENTELRVHLCKQNFSYQVPCTSKTGEQIPQFSGLVQNGGIRLTFLTNVEKNQLKNF